MHFLHVIHRYHPYVGGSETYVQDLSERLVREDHQVTVLTTDAWDLDHLWTPGRRRITEPEETHNGVRILRFPVEHHPGQPRLHHQVRRLMRQVTRVPGTGALLSRLALLSPRVPGLARYLAATPVHFDLVHTTNLVLDFAVLQPLHFARRRSIPHLCTPFVHLGEPGSPEAARAHAQRHQLAALRHAARIMVQTESEGAFLRGQGIPGAKLRTIGCWVKPEELAGGSAERFRQSHTISAPVVLAIGAAAYAKGTVHTIQALQRLWRSGREAVLVLITGDRLPDFDQFFAALPEEDRRRVLLLETAPHQTKLDALAAAEVLVLPSLTDSFGIVFLEAWWYGVPVIGARAGGIPDVIEAGRDGLLVEFGDVAALARQIELLLSDPARARTLGRRGREKVLQRFTFESRYAAIRAVYEEVLECAL